MDSESTPLLAGKSPMSSITDIERHIVNTGLWNAPLKFPITILTLLIAILSLSTVGLLVATHILMGTGPFYGIWIPELIVRDQGIIVRSLSSTDQPFPRKKLTDNS